MSRADPGPEVKARTCPAPVPSRTVVVGLEPGLFSAAAAKVAQRTGGARPPGRCSTTRSRATWTAWSTASAGGGSGAGRKGVGDPGALTNPSGTNCRRRPPRPASRRRRCCACLRLDGEC